MSKLRVPYQCLEIAGNLLVAARGSSIDLFSLEDQSLLSTWKYPSAPTSSTRESSQQITQELPGSNSEAPALPALDVSSQSPPAKRRKLSDGGEPQNPCDEGKWKKKSNHRSDSMAAGLDAPAIITLAVAREGQHVIAATGEDKCIWVFEIVIKEDGMHYLKSVSQRSVKGLAQNNVVVLEC
jgi:tRNA (guanine-N(7)-)-methyltransferase subunit TRM82